MKKNRIMVISLVLVLVAFCVGVSASSNLRTLQNVLVGGITIFIDGKKLEPTDANGKPVDAMIYNGTTYLPVRAVANAFGKAVSWDGNTKTVYLGTADGMLKTPTLDLLDAPNIGGNVGEENNVFDNYGGFYSRALYFWKAALSSPSYETLLGGQYSKIKGTIFISKECTTDNTAAICIIGDDKILYKTDDFLKHPSRYPLMWIFKVSMT